MAQVILKNISGKHRDGRDLPLIRDFHLEIQDRECVALVGPPKCGISSVVRMIAGLDEISKGDIFIGDRRINDLVPKDRDIAMVPRSYVPYPGMSVHDNIGFALTLRRFPKTEIKKRVQTAAELLGLQDLLEDKPGALSGEQRQRVAIARAIALQPKAYLFDEALSDLEAGARAQIRNEIVKLHQRLRVTIIYATHDPIEAMALGGRIVMMKEGVIQQEGTALSLYDEPANAFVAEFLVPAMNLVHGTLKRERDSFVFSERNDGAIVVGFPVSEIPAAEDFAGKPILLGFRSDDIWVEESAKAMGKHSNAFPAIVELIEPIGRGGILHLQTGGHTVVCRSQRLADSWEAGRRLRFELDLKKVRLFDPTSGLRIA
jgi:multiple sugar transport system ATP-binding protein